MEPERDLFDDLLNAPPGGRGEEAPGASRAPSGPAQEDAPPPADPLDPPLSGDAPELLALLDEPAVDDAAHAAGFGAGRRRPASWADGTTNGLLGGNRPSGRPEDRPDLGAPTPARAPGGAGGESGHPAPTVAPPTDTGAEAAAVPGSFQDASAGPEPLPRLARHGATDDTTGDEAAGRRPRPEGGGEPTDVSPEGDLPGPGPAVSRFASGLDDDLLPLRGRRR